MSGLTPLSARADVQVREIKAGVPLEAVANASQKNGFDEIVVRSGKGDVVVYGEGLRAAMNGKLPAVGDKVQLVVPGRTSVVEGTMVAQSREKGLSRDQKAQIIVLGAAAVGTVVGAALTKAPTARTGFFLIDMTIGALGHSIKMAGNGIVGGLVGAGVGGAAAWMVHRNNKPSDEQLKAISTAMPR